MTAEPSVRDRAAEVIRLSRWLSPGEANPSHCIADALAAAGLLVWDGRIQAVLAVCDEYTDTIGSMFADDIRAVVAGNAFPTTVTETA